MKGTIQLGALLVGLAAAGCGGSGGASGDGGASGGQAQTISIGPLSASFTGRAPASVTAGNSGAVVEGVYGAGFFLVNLTPAPVMANTRIAYDFGGTAYSMSTTGSDSFPLTTLFGFFGNSSWPTWSTDGRVAAVFTDISETKIVVANADGSRPHFIYQSGSLISSLSWQPLGQRILFSIIDSTKHRQIYSINADGTGLKHLSNGQFDEEYPSWSADGTRIVFTRVDSTGQRQAYVADSNLGSPVAVASLNSFWATLKGGLIAPVFSPDGNSIAFVYQFKDIWRVSLVGQGARDIVSNGNFRNRVSFSPDGKSIVFDDQSNGTYSVFESDSFGRNPQTIQSATNQIVGSPCWSPFPQNVNFVSNAGLFGNSSSGFLVGMAGSQVGSTLSFTAKTPSSATITGTGGGLLDGDLVFTLSGDSITKLVYENGLYTPIVQVFPSTGITAVNKALVTYDGTSGGVALVVPVYPSARRPLTKTRVGDSLTITGDFPAIYDKNGKNIAPHGASSVSIDAKRGKLIKFADAG